MATAHGALDLETASTAKPEVAEFGAKSANRGKFPNVDRGASAFDYFDDARRLQSLMTPPYHVFI